MRAQPASISRAAARACDVVRERAVRMLIARLSRPRHRGTWVMRLGAGGPAHHAALRALSTALGDLCSTAQPDRLRAGTPQARRWTQLRDALDRVYTAARAVGLAPGDVLRLLRVLDLTTNAPVRPGHVGAVHACLARLRARARTALARARLAERQPVRAPDRRSYGAGLFHLLPTQLPTQLPCIGGPLDGDAVGGWQHGRDCYHVFLLDELPRTRSDHTAPRTRGVWASEWASQWQREQAPGAVHLGSYRLNFDVREAIWVPA